MNPMTVLPNLCFVYVYCVPLLVKLEAWICWHGTNRDSSVYVDKKVSFLGKKKSSGVISQKAPALWTL